MSINIYYEVIPAPSRINEHGRLVLLPVRGNVVSFVVSDELNYYKNGTDVSKIILSYLEVFFPFM
jgi:hypothetical protein